MQSGLPRACDIGCAGLTSARLSASTRVDPFRDRRLRRLSRPDVGVPASVFPGFRPAAIMSMVFDEYGRPFIILREQQQQARIKGLDAQKVRARRGARARARRAAPAGTRDAAEAREDAIVRCARRLRGFLDNSDTIRSLAPCRPRQLRFSVFTRLRRRSHAQPEARGWPSLPLEVPRAPWARPGRNRRYAPSRRLPSVARPRDRARGRVRARLFARRFETAPFLGSRLSALDRVLTLPEPTRP